MKTRVSFEILHVSRALCCAALPFVWGLLYILRLGAGGAPPQRTETKIEGSIVRLEEALRGFVMRHVRELKGALAEKLNAADYDDSGGGMDAGELAKARAAAGAGRAVAGARVTAAAACHSCSCGAAACGSRACAWQIVSHSDHPHAAAQLHLLLLFTHHAGRAQIWKHIFELKGVVEGAGARHALALADLEARLTKALADKLALVEAMARPSGDDAAAVAVKFMEPIGAPPRQGAGRRAPARSLLTECVLLLA